MIVSVKQQKDKKNIKVNTTLRPLVLKSLIELGESSGRKYTDEMREAVKQHLLRNGRWPYQGE